MAFKTMMLLRSTTKVFCHFMTHTACTSCHARWLSLCKVYDGSTSMLTALQFYHEVSAPWMPIAHDAHISWPHRVTLTLHLCLVPLQHLEQVRQHPEIMTRRAVCHNMQWACALMRYTEKEQVKHCNTPQSPLLQVHTQKPY